MNFALLLTLFERLLVLRQSTNVRTPEGRATVLADATGLWSQIRELVPSIPMPSEEEMLGALESRERGHRLNQE